MESIIEDAADKLPFAESSEFKIHFIISNFFLPHFQQEQFN